MSDKIFPHRFETSVEVDAPPEQLFAEVDDHERLSAHMMNSSMMMAGNVMRFEFDESRGRAIGSKIRMSGQMLGFTLDLEEIVTERVRPVRKIWETIGEPKLFVIGHYRMGFHIEPLNAGSKLTVFIEYEDPPSPWTIAGRLFGTAYARWCTENMAKGSAATFAKRG